MVSTLTAGGSILEEIVRLKDCGDARGYPQAIARLASKYPTLTDQFAILNDLKEIDFPAVTQNSQNVAQYFYRAGDGGIERVLVELAELFQSAGKKSLLFLTEMPGEESYGIPQGVECEAIPLFGIGCTNEADLSQRYESLLQAFQKHGIDTYICHSWLSIVCVWDLLLCKLLGIRFILVTHGVFSHPVTLDASEHACFGLLPHIVSLCDSVVCLTETNRQYYSKFNSNSFAIPNPMPSSMKKYLMLHNESAPKSDASLINEERHIFWIGRLDDSKRPLDAVHIMKRVLDAVPNVKLVFVGRSADGRFEQSVLREAELLGIIDAVELRGYTNDVMPCYEEADVILFTTEIEGSPMVLIESAAAGTPVVMYDLPYLATANCNDWISFAPQQNIREAANALISLLSDEEARIMRGQAARAYAKQLSEYDLAGAWEQAFSCSPREENVFDKGGPEATMWSTLFEHNIRGSKAIDQLRASRNIQQEAARQAEQNTRHEFEQSRSWKVGRAMTALPRKLLHAREEKKE